MRDNWNPNTATPGCDWCGECEWCDNLGRDMSATDLLGRPLDAKVWTTPNI